MKKDFRTHFSKARGLGSAHLGTKHFRLQRFTAIANIPLFIFFIGLILTIVGKDYDSVRHILHYNFVSTFLILMLVSGIVHMKIGMQVIIEDYISRHMFRLICLGLNSFFCYIMGVCSILALLKIMLGG